MTGVSTDVFNAVFVDIRTSLESMLRSGSSQMPRSSRNGSRSTASHATKVSLLNHFTSTRYFNGVPAQLCACSILHAPQKSRSIPNPNADGNKIANRILVQPRKFPVLRLKILCSLQKIPCSVV